MPILDRVKRAIDGVKRSVAGDYREFKHAIKNPNDYVVPDKNNPLYKSMTPDQKADAIERQKRVRSGK